MKRRDYLAHKNHKNYLKNNFELNFLYSDMAP
jgi:ribosome biogenesis protein Nip4